MTQEATNYPLPSSADEVAEYVEHIVTQTNEDLKKFRQEQTVLQSHISSVLDDNQNLTSKLEKYQKMALPEDVKHLREQLGMANEALAKALSQIESFKKDRRCLQKIQECSTRTIRNMETELQSYRAQLSKEDNQQIYNITIKKFEHKLTAQQEKIQSQASIIMVLQEQKHKSTEQILELQAELKKRKQETNSRREYEATISSLQKQLKEYQEKLHNNEVLLQKSAKREELAMQKVHESIQVSEAAVKEKIDAEKLAETYKEEAAHLATNIGNIMDEAVTRVDDEVELLKSKLSKRDTMIISLREKLNKQIAEHKSIVEAMEVRYNRMSLKYVQALKQNEKLELTMENYNKRLVEMEQCDLNEEDTKKSKDDAPQLEKYLHAYKDLKEHYMELLKDLTKKFEIEFAKIHKENSELQAENDMLRNGAAGDGIGKFI